MVAEQATGAGCSGCRRRRVPRPGARAAVRGDESPVRARAASTCSARSGSPRAWLPAARRSPRAALGLGGAATLGAVRRRGGAAAACGAASSCADPRPLVDLRTSARRPVLLTNLASVARSGSRSSRCPWCSRSAAGARRPPGTGSGCRMLEAGLLPGPSGVVDDGVLAGVGPHLRPLGPKSRSCSASALMACGLHRRGWSPSSAAWQVVIVLTSSLIGAGLAYVRHARPDHAGGAGDRDRRRQRAQRAACARSAPPPRARSPAR